MGVNLVVTWFLVEAFRLSKEVAMLIAIGIVFLLGYSLNKRFAFRKKYLKTSA
jgi:putative flippase GtrA